MFDIFHGENLLASRTAYLKVLNTETGSEIVRLDGEAITLTDLIQAAESGSLFAPKRLIAIENLFTRRDSKQKDSILKYLSKADPNLPVLVWEKKEISLKTLKKRLPVATLHLFKLQKSIFNFLDAIRPNNTKNLLRLLHKCLKEESPELVIYMTARRVSQLIIGKDLGQKGLSELPAWQRSRLFSQAKTFSLKELLELHSRIFSLDRSLKSGRASLSLDHLLDLVMAEI